MSFNMSYKISWVGLCLDEGLTKYQGIKAKLVKNKTMNHYINAMFAQGIFKL